MNHKWQQYNQRREVDIGKQREELVRCKEELQLLKSTPNHVSKHRHSQDENFIRNHRTVHFQSNDCKSAKASGLIELDDDNGTAYWMLILNLPKERFLRLEGSLSIIRLPPG